MFPKGATMSVLTTCAPLMSIDCTAIGRLIFRAFVT